MSVYIKGMEMPTSCFDCPFRENTDPDTWTCLVFGEKFTDRFFHREHRDERCPLVPVPEHGRLIDADKCIEIIERLRDHAGNEDMAFALNWSARRAAEMPAIIPADPAKEEIE